MNRIGSLLFPTIALALVLPGCNGSSKPPQPRKSAAQPAAAAGDPATANLAPVSAPAATPAQENPPAPPADQGAAEDQSGLRSGAASRRRAIRPGLLRNRRGLRARAAARDSRVRPAARSRRRTMSGLPAIGLTRQTAITGFQARGSWLLSSARCGRQATGAGTTAATDWHGGYWGTHVGFYGGVNYGYGYDGDGYEGGYWRTTAFTTTAL